MQAIKATYNGEVFVPFTRINLPKDKTVYLTLVDGTPEEESSDTPVSDSLLGLLKGLNVKSIDDIKQERLREYLK